MNERKIEEHLMELSRKKYVLEVLRDAFSQNISNKEILIEDYGLVAEEIDWFFNEVLKEEEELLASRLLPTVDRLIMEIEDRMLEIVSSQVRGMKIIMLNNWRELIGSKWMGSFSGREVERIDDNKAIIFTMEEKIWTNVRGEKNVLLIGPGTYYCKFYLRDTRGSITHAIPIHGVALPYETMNKAKRSPPLTYGKFSSHYRKYLINIALDYNLYDPEDSVRLKRMYTRIVYENLSLFELFLRTVRNMTDISESNIALLSALPDYFNRVLLTEGGYEKILDEKKGDVPGLMGYEAGLEKILKLTALNLGEILIMLKELKRRFINYGWEILQRILPR